MLLRLLNLVGITKSDKGLFIWGSGSEGVFGNSRTSPALRTPSNKLDAYSWNSVSVGDNHVVAIRSDGLLFTWGNNVHGQLGDGTTINKSSPVQIGTSSWSKVSAGAFYTLAITTTGTLYAWGNNSNGKLGDGSTISKSSPVQIGTNTWAEVSAGKTLLFILGGGHSAGITTSGALFTWGFNGVGQLGDGTTVEKTVPVQIGTSSWSKVSAGGGSGAGYTMGITIAGALFGWGSNQNGKLGLNTATGAFSSPIRVGTGTWSEVSAGASHTVGITSPGALFGWGAGGLVGDGTTIGKSSPVQIGTSSWSKVSAGSISTLALTSDEQLYGWGDNQGGQLGDGTVTYRTAPVKAVTPLSWTQISSGTFTSGAIAKEI